MMTQAVTLFWFRRDLRLFDNAALYFALKNHQNVLPVFIFDKGILKSLARNDLRLPFIHQQISQLKELLCSKGSDLLIEHGHPLEVFTELVKKFKIEAVYANHDYEPSAVVRDAQIQKYFNSLQIQFLTYKDQCIFEKKEVLSDQQKNYTVFTPYKKKWIASISKFYLQSYPTQRYETNYFKVSLKSKMLTLKELKFEETNFEFPLPTYTTSQLKNYEKTRDFPYLERGTTQLGVHLRFGTLSPRALAREALKYSQVWLSELIWREFFMQILWHYPHVERQSFKPQFEKVAWRSNEVEFDKWCQGKTGYPFVDAGMRQLNQTGHMHNRARMITASFLTKHLLMHWSLGERYFASKLLDYDLSANNGNWQWAAGTGCDAAPYFRVFNPQTQLEKFDPDYKYVKTWVPEFGTDNYCTPLVDHVFARERALNEFKRALK